MAKTMIASDQPINDGQIENILDKLRAALRKHRGEVPMNIAQEVLGVPNFGMELFTLIRTRVEALSTVIIRTVLVDYDLSAEELLAAAVSTGREPHIDPAVLAAMPRPVGMSGKREVSAWVFKPRQSSYQNGVISDTAFQEEYQFHGLIADPWLAFALNVADPSFAETHPNGVPWQDAAGRRCYASFDKWLGRRSVNVSRRDNDWSVLFAFVGRSE